MLECKRNICSYFCIFHMYINCRGLFKKRITHHFIFLINLIHLECSTFPFKRDYIFDHRSLVVAFLFFHERERRISREVERHGVCSFSDVDIDIDIDIEALREIRHETSKAIILDRTYAMRDR